MRGDRIDTCERDSALALLLSAVSLGTVIGLTICILSGAVA